MPFTYCLNTSTIRPVSLVEKIRLAGEHGYSAIELWVDEVYQYVGRGGEIRELLELLARHDLVVPCMIALKGWGDAPEIDYQDALDNCRRRMELAVRFESPYIVATPPRDACPLEKLTQRYRDLLAIGRDVGIKPTFEYISVLKSVWNLSQAWQVVQDADDPDATLVLDAFHSWNSHSTLDELGEIPIERISHYHIDDAAIDIPPGDQTDADRVMPGDGAINLQAEVDLLRERGYHGMVSLELFNPELWTQDPSDVVKLGIERMRVLLG